MRKVFYDSNTDRSCSDNSAVAFRGTFVMTELEEITVCETHFLSQDTFSYHLRLSTWNTGGGSRGILIWILLKL